VLNIDNAKSSLQGQSTLSAATVLSRFTRIDFSNSCQLGAPLHAGQTLAAGLEKVRRYSKGLVTFPLVYSCLLDMCSAKTGLSGNVVDG
jgi:hypothetical protein